VGFGGGHQRDRRSADGGKGVRCGVSEGGGGRTAREQLVEKRHWKALSGEEGKRTARTSTEQSRRDRYKSDPVTSLTGSILLLTDKPELYRTAARRAGPPGIARPVDRPGQVFDVDPSRSGELGASTPKSAAPVPGFSTPASSRPATFLLEVDRPFEYWTVLGRTGESAGEIRFARPRASTPGKSTSFFEFWTKAPAGEASSARSPPARSTPSSVPKPWPYVRESRSPDHRHEPACHLRRGGPGRGALGGGDALRQEPRRRRRPLRHFLTEPEGFRLEAFECPGSPAPRSRKRARSSGSGCFQAGAATWFG